MVLTTTLNVTDRLTRQYRSYDEGSSGTTSPSEAILFITGFGSTYNYDEYYE